MGETDSNADVKTPPAEADSRLRWYQYRLWHMFALLTVAAIGCSWFACKMNAANRQKAAVAAIRRSGGFVRYDYEVDAKRDAPPGPAWFRNLVGVDFLADVVSAYIAETQVGDAELEHLRGMTKLETLVLYRTRVGDAGLEHLRGMTELKWLNLYNTRVGDAGLEHLRGMTKLEMLCLDDTQVSDAGMEHLCGMTRLEVLSLNDTQISDAGVERLQQVLPNCYIMH